MRANLFWFNDEQWAKIEPLLPSRQPEPKPQRIGAF
jgi:transposase